MADDWKQTVAHFSHSAKINSILVIFSEKQLLASECQRLKQCVSKKFTSAFYTLWCNCRDCEGGIPSALQHYRGGSSLPPPAAQQSCPQGQQNFCLRKDWRAGMSRGPKPDQRCTHDSFSALIWVGDHSCSVWAQAIKGKRRLQPTTDILMCAESQLQGCLKIDVCEPWKVTHFQNALGLVRVKSLCNFNLLPCLPVSSYIPLHELGCTGRIQQGSTGTSTCLSFKSQ